MTAVALSRGLQRASFAAILVLSPLVGGDARATPPLPSEPIPDPGKGVTNADDTSAVARNPATLAFLPGAEVRWNLVWAGSSAAVPVRGTSIAAGLPIGPFEYDGMTYHFGQANNALVYPGLGLGTIVSGASKVTDGMLHAAAEAVAGQVDVSEPGAALLPAVENLRASSATSAIAVVKAANADSVTVKKIDNTVQAVQDAMWQPTYADVEA